MIYLKLFENYTKYGDVRQNLILPNVSFCVQENEVYFNPYVTPRMDIITYTSTAKLDETTSTKNGGLHTNAFNTTIKSHTFENGVGTIEFNDDVKSIDNYAFYMCSNLTSVTIPNSVTSIGDYVFSNCTSLSSINIPDGVTSIGYQSFYYCKDLTSIVIPNSVTSIGESAFNGCSSLTSINIPDSITSISSGVFGGCSGFTSIVIPNSVTSIGDAAFNNCINLTSITIPNSITSIGTYAFVNCSSLTSIVSNATTAPTIYNNTFQNVKTDGTLTVQSGSTGYDVWMGTDDYYLGKYNWTKVEQ